MAQHISISFHHCGFNGALRFGSHRVPSPGIGISVARILHGRILRVSDLPCSIDGDVFLLRVAVVSALEGQVPFQVEQSSPPYEIVRLFEYLGKSHISKKMVLQLHAPLNNHHHHYSHRRHHYRHRRHHLQIQRRLNIHHPPQIQLPKLSFSIPISPSLRFSLASRSISPLRSQKLSASFDSGSGQNYASEPPQIPQQNKVSFLEVLKKSNSFLPHVTLASTLLALVFPPSFTWFTNRYYAPALGFLMFAVGVNSSEKDFLEAFKRPAAILAGYTGQFLVKPILGYVFGTIAVAIFGLPTPVGAGIMLVSCVSGAQLSNYATFLTDPTMAPLSIVMTSLSTASAVFITPLLSLLLIGKRLPVDVRGMVSSILQIVVTPVAAGLLLNRFLPRICGAIRPFLPPLSVFVTACCVGAPLAINIESVMSPFGLTVLLLVIAFHLTAFVAGYFLTGVVFHTAPDVKALQRTLSYETGMQSSLLALALANRFFQDPLVGVPPAISTVIMSLMGFSLVMVWAKKKEEQ